MPTRSQKIECYKLPKYVQLSRCDKAALCNIVYLDGVGMGRAFKVPANLLQRVLWNGLGKAEPNSKLMQWVKKVAVKSDDLPSLSINAASKLFPKAKWTGKHKHVSMVQHNNRIYINSKRDDELDMQLERVEVTYLVTNTFLPCVASIKPVGGTNTTNN